jgi:hypothetical protein
VNLPLRVPMRLGQEKEKDMKGQEMGKKLEAYQQRLRLTDPRTIFMDDKVKGPLADLLNEIEEGFDRVWSAEEYSDKDGIVLTVGALDNTLQAMAKAVRESGLLEALIIDSKHPRLESVRSAIHTAFSVDAETDSKQPVVQ